MLFFLFWGPEMSAEEREEEAEAAKYLEKLRLEGVSLAEIGVMQARKVKGSEMPPQDNDEEKGNEAVTEHIE
jgi:SHS family lactate transporter-like MFS transporter